MDLTVQNVYGLLLRSKLMPFEDARNMYARWQEEAKDSAGNLVRFANWMVANKYVTEYQATLLARGHADGFFLGDYKVLDRRGKGRMAGVYKAQHQLGQLVAIKVLPPSKAREPNLLGRFQREAKLAMRLNHPNIVRTFQVGIDDNVQYLVMEYLEGETVEEIQARRGKLPPAEAVRLIYQALLGLQHIHQQGLVHRDLKPANMMLVGGTAPDSTLQATLKILDIGLGRSLFDEGGGEQIEDPGITGEGVLLGTPDYMAPEQARDPRAADIRSDVYSLGCVLYHLIAGQPPFPDTNIISQMIRHATETPKPLAEFNPAVPDGLQQIVNWMLTKDPAQRYPTPERAAQALHVFMSAGAETSSTAEDASLNKYLVWLERENVPAAGQVAMPAPPPTAGNAPPFPVTEMPSEVMRKTSNAPVIPAFPPPSRPIKGKPQAGKHAVRKNRATPPPALPAAAADVEIGPADVELVALTPTGEPWKKLFGLELSRREVIAFAVGAAAGGIVTLLTCLFALRRRDKKPAPVETPAEPPAEE